jgi:hypothetical protein
MVTTTAKRSLISSMSTCNKYLLTRTLLPLYLTIYEGQMSYTIILTGISTDMDIGNILINDSFVSQEHPDLSHKERSRKYLVSH